MGESSHFHLALSGPPANLTVTLSLRRPALFINLCRIPQPNPENCPSHIFTYHQTFGSFHFTFLWKNTSLDSLEPRALHSYRGAHPSAQSHYVCWKKETSSANKTCWWWGRRSFVFPLALRVKLASQEKKHIELITNKWQHTKISKTDILYFLGC